VPVAAAGGAVRPASAGLPSRLDSRDEVARALDLAIDYYRRCEPGSPIPFLLERAKRLGSMSFLELMGDMAPDAVKRVEDLLGTKK
jgi:type VI secretion system protein ImpA